MLVLVVVVEEFAFWALTVLLASAALVVPNASAMMNAIASPSLLLMSLGFSFGAGHL
jgi:hypothetical protein